MDGVAIPLGAEDILEAFNIAIRNERVRALLDPRLNEFRVADLAKGRRPESRVEGLRVIATSHRDPCSGAAVFTSCSATVDAILLERK